MDDHIINLVNMKSVYRNEWLIFGGSMVMESLECVGSMVIVSIGYVIMESVVSMVIGPVGSMVIGFVVMVSVGSMVKGLLGLW